MEIKDLPLKQKAAILGTIEITFTHEMKAEIGICIAKAFVRMQFVSYKAE